MGDALREIAAAFGIKWDGTALEKGMEQVEKSKKALLVFGGFLTATGYAITKFAEGFEQDAGALEDTANSLNMNTRELQELEVAATRAGLRTEQFRSTLLRFQQNAEAAAQGSEAQAKVFEKLGIKVKDAGGHVLGTGDLLTDLAEAFDKVQDPAQRAAMAHDLFGRQGARLATILHSGAGGIEELRGELEALGGGLTEDGIQAAGKLGDEFDRLKTTTNSVRSAIAIVLLPPLTWLAEKTRDAMVWFTRLARSTSLVQTFFVALGAAATVAGAVMLSAFMPVILAMTPWALLIGLVALAVDDLITMFRGGESVSGGLIDALFGRNASKDLAEFLSSSENIKGFFFALSADLDGLAQAAGESVMHVLDQAVNWIDEKLKTIQRAVNRVATGLGFHEVFDMSTTQGTRGLSGTVVGEDQRLGRAQGTAAGGVSQRMSHLERDIFSSGNNPAIAAAGPNTGSLPLLDLTRGLGAGVNHTQIDAPITIMNPTDPVETGRQVRLHLERTQSNALERAHAARAQTAEPAHRGT